MSPYAYCNNNPVVRLYITSLLLTIMLIVSINSCSIKEKEEIYYIEDIDMYMKMIWNPSNSYGIVLFGDNDFLSLSENIDYIKVHKNISTFLLFNPKKKKEICLLYQSVSQLDSSRRLIEKSMSNILFVNNIKYYMNETAYGDTSFYEKRDQANPLIPKKPYIEICISAYFQYVTITKNGETTRLKPRK